MDEHGLARIVGWVSIGVGLSAIAAPVPLMRAFGMGDRPKLAHFLGVRDLVLGAGILRGQNVGAWVQARGVADALDGMLIIGGAATGAFRRDRAPIGLTRPTFLLSEPSLLTYRSGAIVGTTSLGLQQTGREALPCPLSVYAKTI